MIYIVILNNGGHYFEDYTDWVAGVFQTKKEAVDCAKLRTRSDFFNIEKWEIGKEKPTKRFHYDFSETIRKWKFS